jgi:hypothetical protein
VTEQRCELCRFWPLSSYSNGKIGDKYYGIGGHHTDGSVSDCRRRAPAMVDPHRDAHLWGSARWPTTKREDWCGDFEARVSPEP